MFYLDFKIPPSPAAIGLKDEVMLLGSCFSENIGQKFQQNKFQTTINPFGTIYNPISIFSVLHKSITDGEPKENEFIGHQGIYHWWYGHSQISGLTLNEAKNKVSEALQVTGTKLNQADWLILTPGTAWVYELSDSGMLVANCHKQPGTNFKKRLLTVDEILKAYNALFDDLKTANPNLKVIWTISPVRHIKDGLVENNRSKSTLHLSIEEIVKQYNNNFYFPSYEIMVDQLRDYRFYNRDLVHPNSEAIAFIWEVFQKTYFDVETIGLLTEWDKISKSLAHKPFHPQSDAHQKFISATISKLERLGKEIDLETEITELRKQKII